MRKRRTAPLIWRLIGITGLILITVVIVLTILPAAAEGSPISGSNLRLFGKTDGKLVLVTDSSEGLSAYYKDLTSSESELEGPFPLPAQDKYFLSDGKLQYYEWSAEDEMFFLYSLYPENQFAKDDLESLSYYISGDDIPENGISKEDIDEIAFAADGTMYATSKGKLYVYLSEDFYLADTGIQYVQWIHSTPGGWIYLYANNKLSRWQGSSYNQQDSYDAPRPKRLVGEDSYIDESRLYSFFPSSSDPTSDDLVPIQFNVGEEVSLNMSTCDISDDQIYIEDFDGVVHQFDREGNEIGAVSSDGEVLAISSGYAVIRVNGGLSLIELEFTPPEVEEPEESSELPTEPTIDPNASASPDVSSSEPEPSTEPTPDAGSSEPAPGTTEPPITESPDPATPTPEPGTPDPEESTEPDESGTPTPSSTPPNDEIGKLIEKLDYEERVMDSGTKYVLLRAGARAKDLRDIHKPQAIDIYTQDGDTVYEATLKTGMTLGNGSVIVIRGDCNGSGTVTSKDIYFVSECILNVSYFETEAAFLAADMNGDEQITTKDLVLISSEINRKGIFE